MIKNHLYFVQRLHSAASETVHMAKSIGIARGTGGQYPPSRVQDWQNTKNLI